MSNSQGARSPPRARLWVHCSALQLPQLSQPHSQASSLTGLLSEQVWPKPQTTRPSVGAGLQTCSRPSASVCSGSLSCVTWSQVGRAGLLRAERDPRCWL